MLLAICLLEVWRLTGVPIHEFMAAALAAGVFVHLLMQRSWVATTVGHLRSSSTRVRLNLALNILLFIAFTAAFASGVAISKAMLPRGMTPAEFLRWHSVHDASSKLLLLFAGLHVALNWDRLATRFTSERPRAARRTLRHAWLYTASLVVVALLVSGAVYGIEKALPKQEFVFMVTKDGQTRRVPPPPDLVQLRADQRSPNLAGGLPKFAATAGIVGIVGLLGRTVLRVRL